MFIIRINKQWGACDAIYSKTEAKTSRGVYLGSVEVWQ